MNLPQLPVDKANHFVYGAAIACVMSIFFGPWWSLVVVSIVAFLKEAIDAWDNYKVSSDPLVGPHGVELWDALATIAGAVVVAIPQIKRL